MIIGRWLRPLNSSRTMRGVRRRDDNSRKKVQMSVRTARQSLNTHGPSAFWWWTFGDHAHKFPLLWGDARHDHASAGQWGDYARGAIAAAVLRAPEKACGTPRVWALLIDSDRAGF